MNTFGESRNEKDTARKLELLDLPEVEMPLHKNCLKQALLFSDSGNAWRPHFFSEMVRRTSSISVGKKIVSLGSVIAVVTVGVVGYVGYQGLSGSTPQAQARVVAEQSITRLGNSNNLSAVERAMMNQVGGPENLKKLLESAKNAKDLTVLTYDEFVSQPPQYLLSAQDPVISAEIRGGKFLEFTGTDGSKVTIGLGGESNLPFWWKSDGSRSSSGGAVGGITVSRPGVPTHVKATGGTTITGSATPTVAAQ